MDGQTQRLRGSPSRDAFKYYHKQGPSVLYACDLDLVLVTKGTDAKIVAAFDYKQPHDRTTFAEIIAYNDLMQKGIPIFIIVASYDIEGDTFGLFTVLKYFKGDWRPHPPVISTETLQVGLDFDKLFAWEKQLRNGTL